MKKLLLLVACLWLPTELLAQGAEGYTSIDFDPSTNTVIGYSETDLDPELAGYYAAILKMWLNGPDGQLGFANVRDYGDAGTIGAILTADGAPDSAYSVTGEHWAIGEIFDCPISCGYEDYYDLMYWPPQGVDEDLGYDFQTANPIPQHPSGSDIKLGRTEDSASLTTPGACGDERDTIVAEYVTYHVGLRPNCSSFTQTSPSTYYGFSTLDTSDYSWAILMWYLGSNLDAFYPYTPWSPITLNSVYRNPSRNNRVGGAGNSRHQFGDAVDVDVHYNQTDFNNMHSTIKYWANVTTQACFEPQSVSSLNHVHADWRPWTSCAPAWRY